MHGADVGKGGLVVEDIGIRRGPTGGQRVGEGGVVGAAGQATVSA
jgi:hypothetical protein